MKRAEIESCLRLYQKKVTSFGRLASQLQALREKPSRVLECIDRAEKHLDELGDGLAVLPELATALLEEKRLSAHLRRTLEKAGVSVTYKDLEDRVPGEEREQEDDGPPDHAESL